jgi:hypothetical protein
MARIWWRLVLMQVNVQCGMLIGVILLLECSEARSIAQRKPQSWDMKTRNIRMSCLGASRCNCRPRASYDTRRNAPATWSWSCALLRECGEKPCLAKEGSNISRLEKRNGEMSGRKVAHSECPGQRHGMPRLSPGIFCAYFGFDVAGFMVALL